MRYSQPLPMRACSDLEAPPSPFLQDTSADRASLAGAQNLCRCFRVAKCQEASLGSKTYTNVADGQSYGKGFGRRFKSGPCSDIPSRRDGLEEGMLLLCVLLSLLVAAREPYTTVYLGAVAAEAAGFA